MRLRSLSVAGILLVLLAACQARPAGEEGLPDGGGSVIATQLSYPNVRCFSQDSLGRMWIGTERGLNRYNGYDFHQYLHRSDSTSLPDNRIYDIGIDPDGRVWVGTEDGVACSDGGDRFVRVPIESDEKAVEQVLCTRSGRVILNMQEDLCVWDPDAGRFLAAVPVFDRFFSYHSRCYLDTQDRLWVVAPMEIRTFETDTFRNLDNFPTAHFVTTSALLSDGQVWMSGRHRMSIFDTRTHAFLKMPQTVVRGLSGREVQLIFEYDPSTVLFKTSDGGLYSYDRAEDRLTLLPGSLFKLPAGFEVQALYRDRRGDLWLGSDAKGFQFFPDPAGALHTTGMPERVLLEDKPICSMSLDREGALWLFSLHDGLYRYDTATGALTAPPIEGYPREDRTDFLQTNLPLVFAASDGSLWLSFPNQPRLLRGRYRNGKVFLTADYPAFYPRVAMEDPEGGVWFGTRNEFLLYMAPGGRELERVRVFPYQTTFINCLLALGDEILTGAYNQPFTLLDIHTRQTRQLSLARSGTGDDFIYPTAVLRDSRGDLWIGSRYRGISRYSPSDRSLVRVAGTSDDICSIAEDASGRIWASSANGLVRFDPESGRFHDYFPPKASDRNPVFYERASAVLPGGALAFGGAHGLTVVYPEESPAEGGTVPLVFENLKVHGRIVPGGLQSVVLPHGDNTFSLTFAAPDFRNLSQVRYSCCLEGYDRDWVDLGSSREAFFSNVPAGHYRLRVRYSLQGDGAPQGEALLPVRIVPSPWLSWPAILAYLLLGLGLVFALWRIRQRFRQERAATAEAEREKEQERKVNRMNMAFFANISHEFRTPLTMISGPVSELARSERIEDEDRYQLTLVQRSVGRMLTLVNQLMDFNRLENATLRLQVTVSDVVPVIKDSLEIFRLNAASLGIILETDGLEYPLVFPFDADKLQKILSNLLSNALKFTPRGGKVRLSVDQVLQEGHPFLRIDVSDTGPGIPEAERERIFDRYYQLDNSRKGKYNYGTGIGLYYARSLAEIHHGHLWAGSRPDGGEGAVFTLTLPMEEAAYAETERVRVETPVSGDYPLETMPEATPAPPQAGEDERPLLLAVDDDPDVVRYLKALFSAHYRVACAYGADEALSLAGEQTPDIVLCDVVMPGKSGFELCREIKSNLQLCHVPVILVTAMGTVQNQVQGLDLGADAYVTKPFDPSYLKALVRSQLENRRRVQSLVNAATESSEVEELSARDQAFLQELYDLMEREISNEDLDIAQLSGMLKISRSKLYYKIKGLTGKTPSEFFMQYKLNVAAKLLKEGQLNVSEIAFKTGFSTLPHFSKAFKKQFGVSPSKYAG